MQPYPPQDETRIHRILAGIGDLMHQPYTLADDDSSIDMDARPDAVFRRWVRLVLADAESRTGWWFLRNVAGITLAAGQDVVDLVGDIGKVAAAWAPKRLHKTSLEHVTELRQAAEVQGTPNAANECTHYALEAGRRLHLWPAPAAALAFKLQYTRPMAVELLPGPLWERIVINGAIGLYGRHWDRDALAADPAALRADYERDLRRARVEDWDQARITRYDDDILGDTLTASSATDTATAVTLPTSLTGIGHACINTLEVT